MKKVDNLNDQKPSTSGTDDSLGGLLNNDTYYMPPGASLVASSVALAQSASAPPKQAMSMATASQNTSPGGESLQNMIGLSDLVYSSLDPKHALPQKYAIIKINDVGYEVLEVENGPSGYEGMVLYDQSSKAIIVVNRGTQSGDSFGTDADMAFNTVNNQWKDALALAQLAANDATTLGASATYTTGHSLGGTLAQMQAAYFGWQGYTFNAYGAGEVYSKLGLTISNSASIKNYRTMFDLVSDASTHLGDTPITIETPYDSAVLDDFYSKSVSTGFDLLLTIGKDHSLSNFHGSSDPAGNLLSAANNVYTLAPGFAHPVSGQKAALAQDIVSSFGELIHLGLESSIGPFTSGDLTLQQSAQELQQFINNDSQSGIKAIVPSDPSLLSNALNPDAAYDAYRASLSALSPVVLQGLDSSSYANASLWAPGQTTGLTKDYLEARNDMIQAMIVMAGQGQAEGGSVASSDANTYVYSDLGRSSSPMYTIDGKGGQTYDVIFSSVSGSAMTASSGAYAELFGGAGNDTLFGGAVGSTLQGGAGNDVYVIDGSGTGLDYILDTDGSGEVEWKFADGTTETLTGGDDQPGTLAWKSTDGRVTYTEVLGADGRTALEIQSGKKIAYVEDFTNGELGITLNTGASAPTGASNLSALKNHGLAGNTNVPGDANYVYTDDIAGALVGSIYGADSSGSPYGNQINGEGNASYIFAGNGDNAALLGDFGRKATDPLATPMSAVLQGGTGKQILIGAGNGTETITGGSAGSDTSATTYIDGGGATAMLVGGGQNSYIFGGTGADTILASSTNGSSPAGFNPATVAMAGVSFWGDAYSTQPDENNNPYTQSSLPKVNATETSSDDVQVNLSLYQSDGTFGTPFGLLGSSYDPGVGSTTLPGSELIGGTGFDWLIGNVGSDTIIGGSPATTVTGAADEVLVGGAGADLIYGGAGTELIYADMTPGADSNWANLDPSYADTIFGGSGTDYIYGSAGNDLIYGGSGTSIIHAGNGNSYIDTGDGQASVYGGSGHDTIVVDGTAASIQVGAGATYIETRSGLARITTGTGNDTIEASGGNAIITEGGGQTTVIAGASTGSDTIQAGSGNTVLQLVDGLTESTLVTRDVNGDLVLSDPGFDTQITVTGYFNESSGVSVKFDDGTTWNATQILAASMAPRTDGGNDTLVGSNGNDSITAGYGDTSIVGTSGNNTLTGGAGSDTIQGGSGADTIEGGSGTTQILGGTGLETYTYNLGDGADTIFENTTAAGADVLKFGVGISSSNLTYVYDPATNNLEIGFAALSNAALVVVGFKATQPNQHQITTFSFADGTTLTQLQVFQKAVAIDGAAGNDTLVGTAAADYFDGKGGDDIEVGNGGSDTFVFNSGYGHLEINESYTSGQAPVLQLGAGISASALHVTSNGTNLTLTDGVSGDQITLGGMLSSSNTGVTAVQLADGTSLTAAQLIQKEMTGATGNDTIFGTSGADLIDGKGGNDSVNGEGGSDTFVFDSGYGHLEINENYTSGQQPVLQLDGGITASALHVTANSSGNLTLTDGVSGDQITLDGMAQTGGDGVAVAQFADGTSLTAAQLIQMAMSGTAGSDTIYGTPGADLIDGKGGGDSVIGNGGNDTFVYNKGYGELIISDTYSSGQQPVLELGKDITASTLVVSSDSYNGHDDLVLTDGTSGDQIYLLGEESVNDTGVAEVKLADGTTYTAAQLIHMSHQIYGSTGSDTLDGTSGDDLIDGRGGGDSVNGYGGSDTFVFAQDYGDLTINQTYSSGQQPVLQLGAGITTSMLHATTNGQDILLTDGTAGDEIDLLRMWTDSSSGVAAVQLADGTTITRSQLVQMAAVTQGTTGNDKLYGTSSAELFDGKGGNDFIDGGGGNDTFVFNAGYGQLSIYEEDASSSIVELGAGITLANLKVSLVGNETFITDGTSGDQITLENGNISVQLSDGTTLTPAQLITMGHTITGTTGSDTLYVGGGDTVDGMGGDDYFFSSGGNDTFVFKPGYGQLTINQFGTQYGVTEAPYSGDLPVVKMGAGITASMLHVMVTPGYNESSNGYGDGAAAPADIVITDGISGDQITLDNMWDRGDTTLPVLQFTDGTSMTVAQLEQMELTSGTAGNDTIYGTLGADLIDGKGGADSVYGSGISDDAGNTYQLYNLDKMDDGSDTFVFNAGYGSLGITEQYSTSQPVLQLGAGITASSLHVTSDGNSLYLTDGISGDQIKLWDMFTGATAWGSSWGVAEVQLADGTILARSQLIQMEMTGTTGNDTIYGTSGADLIDGKGGNDSVNGDGGNDTFLFNAGNGQLTINEAYASGQRPVLQLGAGITASALKVTTDGTNLMLSDGVSGDQVTLDDMWSSSSTSGVAVVQLADGTSLTAAQLIQMGLAGTTGNDSIVGTPEADLIDGKGGNDSVNGEGGNDTFVYKAGYGKLSIYELQNFTGSSPNQAALKLGSGISSQALHVREDDQHDLILTDGVAGDQVTLKSPYGRNDPVGSAWGADVQFSDGSTLSMDQLQQMASDLNGTSGSDFLVGTAGADLIDGKGGDDVELGNAGSDTFVYNQGYGALEIGGGTGYTLQLGPGITKSNVRVFQSQMNDVILSLTDGAPGEVIRLDGAFNSTNGGILVKFSDGTAFTLSQLNNGYEFYNYSGDETFRLGMSSTSRTLVDKEGSVDLSYVDGITSADVAVQGSVDGYLTLTNKLTGSQFSIPDYVDGTGDLMVTFSDGVTWGAAQILQAMGIGGPGNDTLSGTSGAELFDGKGGNDLINGGGGSDTFVFNSGYGDLEINEIYTVGQRPVLRLGAGISVSTLHAAVVGTNLVLTDGVSGDQITLDNQNASGTVGVWLVQFADGETLTAAQLFQLANEIAGTVGNDTLAGTSGVDWIDGKGGNDSVIGNGGSDTFVFNSGYGHLEINEAYTSGQQPILRLGAGISASALEATANGTNVVLTDGVSGDQITLDNQNASGSDGVALVQFADGTTWTAAQLTLLSKEIRGTTGNDTLTGTSGADWIDGKGGNDSVIGNGGNDTFVFNPSYGDLEINEAYTSGQQPVLQLGAGITSSALQVALVGANVVLTDGVSGDQITLDNQNVSGSDGVALVKFADGTSLTAAQLIPMAHEFIGTTGNDVLTGNSGADLVDGKGGNDTVIGNGGNDTFVFNVGYGQLDIKEQYTSGQTPVLQLGAGITTSNLKVTPTASGSGLVLTDGTSGDQITLEGAAFDDSKYGIQEVKLADGTTLTAAQLLQMETSLPGNGGSVTGGGGNDTLVADTANESLIGGAGSEVFDFNTGFGQDTVVANGSATSNTILFGAGITSSNLNFSTDGSELTITDTSSTGADGQASTIVLPGHFVNGTPVTDVGELLFNDGSYITMAQINQLFAQAPAPAPAPAPSTTLTAGASNTLVSDNGVDLLQANSGNDTLTGGSGTDTLESGVGNTLMNGGTGTETYLFNTGFGQDTVAANGSATSNTILFGAGITSSNLNFSTDGSELTITDTSSNGADGQASSIVLPGHFVNGNPVTDVGELLFNDGSYITMAQINQLFAQAPAPAPAPAPSTTLTAGASNTLVSDNGVDLLQANAGNDTLTGGTGTDTLESGVGNTLMNGGTGTETYLFNTGFGQDTVVANDSATSNTILFGAGITSSNLNFSTDGSELTITDTSSTGADGQASTIVLPGHFVNGNPVTDVGELLFNDGSYITMAQINQLFAQAPAPAPAPAASTAAAAMMAMTATKGSSAAPSTGAIEKPSHTPRASAIGSPPWLATHGTGVYGPDLQGTGTTEGEWMRQINMLTHAIAGFTGGGAGMDTSMPITPALPVDLMLHVAA